MDQSQGTNKSTNTKTPSSETDMPTSSSSSWLTHTRMQLACSLACTRTHSTAHMYAQRHTQTPTFYRWLWLWRPCYFEWTIINAHCRSNSVATSSLLIPIHQSFLPLVHPSTHHLVRVHHPSDLSLNASHRTASCFVVDHFGQCACRHIPCSIVYGPVALCHSQFSIALSPYIMVLCLLPCRPMPWPH